MRAHDFRFYFTPLQGFFSPFPHGTGSLSVTDKYLALEGGPPGFSHRFTCDDLLGIQFRYIQSFAYGAITLFCQTFQNVLLECISPYQLSRNPKVQVPWFRLIRVRSPLLAESRLISTPPVTEMFHFAGYRSIHLWIQYIVTRLSWLGFPIRKSPGQSQFAATRSLSQLVTSFIACQCQGIHHVPLAA